MDLDETLLSSDKHVCDLNKKALERARSQGIHTVIATGRPWFSFAHTLDEIKTKELPDEYSISLNGGAIVKNGTGEIVFLDGMEFSRINELFLKGLNYDVFMHVYTTDAVYGWNLDEDEREFLKGRLDIHELEEPDLSFLKDESFVKILFGRTDMNYLHAIENDMEGQLDDLDVSYSSNRYIEFNKKGVSKGTGLKHLARIYGLQISECAAVGDNLNDLSMIEQAGIGIAVGNALDEIKAAADWILEADHNHGAIAQAVEKIEAYNEKEPEATL